MSTLQSASPPPHLQRRVPLQHPRQAPQDLLPAARRHVSSNCGRPFLLEPQPVVFPDHLPQQQPSQDSRIDQGGVAALPDGG
jgi:hypothetical protein